MSCKDKKICCVINSRKISLSVQENPLSAVLPSSLELNFNLVSKGRGKTALLSMEINELCEGKGDTLTFAAKKGLKEKVKIKNCSTFNNQCQEWESLVFHPIGLSLTFFQYKNPHFHGRGEEGFKKDFSSVLVAFVNVSKS